jgi:hypothetical protein
MTEGRSVPGLVRVLLLAAMLGACPAVIAPPALAQNEPGTAQSGGTARTETPTADLSRQSKGEQDEDPRKWWQLRWLGTLTDSFCKERAPLTAVLTIAVLVLLFVGVSALTTRHLFARRINRVEDEARKALRKDPEDSLTLDDLPGELERFRKQVAGLTAENIDLCKQNDRRKEQIDEQEQELAIARAALPKEPDGPEARLANAGRTAIREALACFDRLGADRDFKSLDGTLNIRDALAAVDSLLEKVAKGTSADAAAVTAALRAGELDTVLTLAGFLDVYFPMQDDWYAAGRAVTAVEALIRSMLARERVEVYAVRPLSRLRSHREGAEPYDRRNIHDIEPVRRAVTDQAPYVSGDDLLVIDCSAPGWIIAGGESSPPLLSLYNAATWSS